MSGAAQAIFADRYLQAAGTNYRHNKVIEKNNRFRNRKEILNSFHRQNWFSIKHTTGSKFLENVEKF